MPEQLDRPGSTFLKFGFVGWSLDEMQMVLRDGLEEILPTALFIRPGAEGIIILKTDEAAFGESPSGFRQCFPAHYHGPFQPGHFGLRGQQAFKKRAVEIFDDAETIELLG